MLSAANRLRSDKEIETVFKKGRSIRGQLLGLKFTVRKEQPSRFAFIVSTKVSKKAVVRNKIKRRMREIVRPLLPQLLEPADVTVMAQNAAKDADFAALKQELISVLIRAKLLPPLRS